jgi:hypothetical protein
MSSGKVGYDSKKQRAEAVWHIQFCVEKIDAQKVELFAGEDEATQTFWKEWVKNQDPPRQVLPDNLKTKDNVFVRGVAVPEDNSVVFCLKFNNFAVKNFDFDDAEGGRFNKDDRDGECQC